MYVYAHVHEHVFYMYVCVYICICVYMWVCMCVCTYTCSTAHIWRSEDKWDESFLYFHHVDPGDLVQMVDLVAGIFFM